MKTSAASAATGTPRTQQEALITLLSDEDEGVYQAVRSKILSFGPEAGEWLKPCLLSDDPLLRRRTREIVELFSRQEADNRFLVFCIRQGEEFDLEEASLLLSRTRFPGINADAYTALLDGFTADLRSRLQTQEEPRRILAVINQFLFGELGFQGNDADYYNPENSYLNRVLDRRTGNPVSLCLVYLLVARRLRLPVAGIGLPGHFLCRYQTSREEIYIDAFHQGRLLSKTDCLRYLFQSTQDADLTHLSPVSARRIMLRICANLHQIYTQIGQTSETARFHRYLVALAK